MPNAPAPGSERSFCSTCGFPVRGSRCEACGSAADARRAPGDDVPTKENHLRPYASPAEADVAGLEKATEAFRAKDLPLFVEHLLAGEAVGGARSLPSAEGAAWIAVVSSAPIFVTLRAAFDEIVLEAPVARLPARRRLPALRHALELCASDAAASRVCLRGDLLLLRFTMRPSSLTPAVLRYHLREMGHLATRYAGLMTAGLDALPGIPDDQRNAAGFEAIGRTRKIHLGAGGGPSRSLPPPGETRSRPVTGARPLKRDEEPPAPGRRASQPLASASAEGIPAVLAPPPEKAPRTSTRPRADSEGASRGPSEPLLSPSDRLCMLLRHAQSLASLTLEERPATLVWLVRSAVFRAIYDYKDLLPDAIAHLYRCTGVGRDAPPARSTSGQIQATEPALVVIERVIVSRGQVAKEKPLAIEPMTSAAQAKEHVARYLSEIDRAPGDPGLRHFLALGALTELLVRTKLPPQTDQRLRDIVTHAQREGAKGAAIDLMMTALQRINA